jgi:crotonobetainyl-CoA:carnitine CoA-transferase CaiB-like acyl-CoA transferase
MRLPLSGLRVLTMEQFGAGPFGSMYLADMGAEVIKIENPATGGDASRSMGPNYLGEHDSEYFQSLNINKKSMTLNLKTAQGREVLARLAAVSDVVMNNMRGDQPGKLGLDYATLGPHNPRLICAHLSAYGRDNDRAGWPGYDYLMQAEAGFFSVTGEPGTPPARFGLSVVDFLTGITTAFAVVAALFDANRTGQGRDVDVSLFDVALHELNYPGTWYLNSGTVTGRLARSSHPTAVPVQLIKTRDGWVFVMCMMQKFWDHLVQVIQRPDLAADPRFSDMKQRAAHRDDLTPLLDEILSTRDTAYWVDALAGKVPVSPVYDLPQALENPFAHDVGMIRNVPHPAKTDFRTFANPIKLDGQRVPAQTCAGLGANTSDLLQEVGYDPADIDGLRSDGVI